jgi:hypothetical protein
VEAGWSQDLLILTASFCGMWLISAVLFGRASNAVPIAPVDA